MSKSTHHHNTQEQEERPQSAEEFVEKYDRELIEAIAADGSAAAAEALALVEESANE
jgi:hypothetical protein